MHFPKCAGSATEAALRRLYLGKPGYTFDQPAPAWHENVAQRMKRVPGFAPGDRTIICNFRRLPSWIISRVRYEQSQPPHHAAPREMFLSGRFFENDGSINTAEGYVKHYMAANKWIRAEHLAEDFEKAFGVSAPIERVNETSPEVSDVRFHLSRDDIVRLYEICPTWAALERKLYGSLAVEEAQSGWPSFASTPAGCGNQGRTA